MDRKKLIAYCLSLITLNVCLLLFLYGRKRSVQYCGGITVLQKRMTTINWFGQFTARLENVGNCGLAIWLLLRVDLAVSGRNQPRLVWPVGAGVLYVVQRCEGERYKQKANL